MNRRSLPLQLELLRLRGELEREQVVAALVDLRTSTRRIGAVAAAVSNLRASRGGWLGALLETVGSKAKWAPLALMALRSVRRHPAAALVATAAATALVGWLAGKSKEGPSGGDRSG